MSTKLAFHPMIGLNSQILEQEPMAGCMWFALDTKRIYYSDGTSFLSMGGNTGIYYGNMTLEEEPDSDQVDFDFSVMDIDGNQSVTNGNYKIPNKDDLILKAQFIPLQEDLTLVVKLRHLHLSLLGWELLVRLLLELF